LVCSFRNETRLRALGFSAPAGVDEVGRGCLFGPVTAAAVILPERCKIRGINDSKVLAPEVRESLAIQIKAQAIAWSVGWASVAEIERLNILGASRLAMCRAVSLLRPAPDYLLIDAIRIELTIPQEPIIDGDAQCRSIAAASIVAKVTRDRLMAALGLAFPDYGFERHKGYGTDIHRECLHRFGATIHHRVSFAPVRARVLAGDV
jgi:ribonuclease HII